MHDTHDMSTRLDAERRDEQDRVEIELGSSDPLDQLRGLRAANRQLAVWQRQTITRAREQGASWTQIGDALGVTKQAAWAPYNQDVGDALDAAAFPSSPSARGTWPATYPTQQCTRSPAPGTPAR